MKNLHPVAENGSRNGVSGLEMRPDQEPASIHVKVSHGPNEFVVVVPSNSSFADLKSVIAEKLGVKLETHKLLFRGKEKEDDELLEPSGVKENSKVLLVEDTPREPEIHEEVKETSVPSKGGEAVAQVKKEVDKLAEQVSAFQVTLDSGKKVDEKQIAFLIEMLMRQFLKLDGIDAEGEGKVQRKMEVRRVQSLVDTMDVLKLKNSNRSSDVNNTAPVTTQWENFEPAPAPANSISVAGPTNPNIAPTPAIHNPVPVTACASPAPPPANPTHAPSLSASSVPSSATGSVQYPVPGSAPAPAPSPTSPVTSPAMPYNTTNPPPSYGPSPHAPHQYETPSHYGHSPNDSNFSYHNSGYNAQHTPYAHSTFEAHHNSYAPHYPPNPYAAAPYPPAAYAAAPYPPAPYAAAPYAANPYEPTHFTHNPYAPSYYAPQPMPSYNHSPAPPTRPSEEPSSGASYAPGMPSSTTVTRDWERFE